MLSTDWLIFGATGAVGRFLLARVDARGETALAVSRRPMPDWAVAHPRADWRRLDLDEGAPEALPFAARVVSAGPLDAFSRFCLRAGWPAGTRVVALSSMSALSKQTSSDPEERALARRLVESEQRLVDVAAARGWRVTLLRPTLIWGAGLDRSLSALVALARRWSWLPLPGNATGLRQPVHADDLALAMIAAATSERTDLDRAVLPLPGGETLSFRAMIERCLAVAAPDARVVSIPPPLVRLIGSVMEQFPGRPSRLAAQLRRSSEDLAVDEPSGWHRLGVAPRAFLPSPEAFRDERRQA